MSARHFRARFIVVAGLGLGLAACSSPPSAGPGAAGSPPGSPPTSASAAGSAAASASQTPALTLASPADVNASPGATPSGGGPAAQKVANWPLLTGPTGAAASTAMSTPGSYVYYSFPSSALSRIDFSVTVTQNPGSGNVYWSNQFGFTNGIGGYAGMQAWRGAPGSGMFLYSVWSATGAKPGSTGTYCSTFQENGAGQTCRLNQRPIAGHTYDFRLTADGGDWFTITVLDTTAGTSFVLGHIETAKPGQLSPTPMTWTEYFDWNSKSSSCASQPYSEVSVSAVGDGHQASITGSSTSKTCTGWSHVSIQGSQATEQNGLGDSLAGQLEFGGKCLAASGSTLTLAGCDPAQSSQTWTAGSDGSLRPASAENQCAGASTIAPCSGADDQLWHYDPATGTVTNRAGAALAGANGGGWTVPAYMH